MMGRKEILTVPNAVTLFGLLITVFGASQMDQVFGVLLAGVGRVFDLADGYLARKMGQGTSFGAGLDALSDKLGGLAILIAEWHYGIAPLIALLALFLQNIANTIISLVAVGAKHHALRSSIAGKHAMFTQNIAVGAYAVASVIPDSASYVSDAFYILGHAATVVGVGYFGLRATLGYFSAAKQINEHK